MNPKEEDYRSEEASSASTTFDLVPVAATAGLSSSPTDHLSDTMKRASAKKLIERYFYQLTDGCGNSNCDSEFCASSGRVNKLEPNEAAAQAIELFRLFKDAKLCDGQPSKVARTQNDLKSKTTNRVKFNTSTEENSSKEPTSNDASLSIAQSSSNSFLSNTSKESSDSSSNQNSPVPFINTEKLIHIIETCKNTNSYSLLIRTLGEVYSQTESLSQSFKKEENRSAIDAILDRAPPDLDNLKKEDIRVLEGDKDKDEDSQESSANCSSPMEVDDNPSGTTTVDIPSLRRAYDALFELPISIFESALSNALITLSENIELDLRLLRIRREKLLNIFVIIFDIPTTGFTEFIEYALPHVCKAASRLPLDLQAELVRIWAKYSKNRLKTLLQALHELITIRTITGHFTRDYCVQDEWFITEPTKVMKLVYYANILAGELDSPELRREDPNADEPLLGGIGGIKSPKLAHPEDLLSKELGITSLDSRQPYIPFTEFYNEPLSDAIEMDKDFAYYKTESSSTNNKFSFMNYSFILTPATKTLGLYYDNRIRMYNERRMSFIHTVVGQPTNPYLRLKVRRDHLIDDALVELEMVAMENPKDLKKQLVVEFEGEQGIDEGGVSKEFFQLIVEEIFNPDYGMFTCQPENGTVWFNPTSFESDAQFTLIGIVLGLAIYNNIILDIHFPMVVYKKLMGKRGTYHDLEDFNKTLYTGLKAMLEYEGDDMEETFVQTFRVCYQDVFGSTFFRELKEGGDSIYVNQSNKQEFVDLYADFLQNISIEKQFRAFRRGFRMVTDESPLNLLFRPEEVEQLVCGSKNFDFAELEEATEYDGGYTAETPTIRHFWTTVHQMTLESKRKLLQFATGSDRVPVGGLCKLKLVIARHGPDTDRLPTAHTCFNVLLLPEYGSQEKLTDRLMKAINYSKGFGML